MLTIWGRTSSVNVQKVMWAVRELGLEHERIDAGGSFGGVDTPEYAAMNPNRLIPTLRDGEVVVWESHSIVRYLAARYGAGALWPEDPAVRSRADRWMDWQQGPVLREVGTVFWGLVRTPAEKRDVVAIEAAAHRAGPHWQVLDEHLARAPFVAGDTLTMGDIPVGCLYWRYANLEIERPDLPNLQRWSERLQARDAYRREVMLPLT